MVRVLIAALLVLLVACGKGSDIPTVTELEPGDRLLRDRAALAAVRNDPLANKVQLDIARAEAWLNRAEFLLNGGNNPSLRDELMRTAEGQISSIQAQYARLRVPPPPEAPESDSATETNLED